MSIKRRPSEAGSSRPVIRTLRRALTSCVVAILSVALAVVITLFIGPVMKHSATFFFCSVMLTSWCGGLWPGGVSETAKGRTGERAILGSRRFLPKATV